MTADLFIDTNILIYALDKDAGEKNKKANKLITELWEQDDWPSISIQVLLELHVNLTRKGVADDEASSIVRDYTAWNVIENSLPLFEAGLEEKTRWKLSIWDSMIIAAARKAGVSRIWTEDLSDGRDYGGILVENPLKA